MVGWVGLCGCLRRDRCVRKETAVGVCYGWMGGVVWVSEKRLVCTEGDRGWCIYGWMGGVVWVSEKRQVCTRKTWVCLYSMHRGLATCRCSRRDSCVSEEALGCLYCTWVSE
jgi:hypothetical protein